RLGGRVGVVGAFAFAAVVAAGIGVAVLLFAQRSLIGFADAVDQPAWMWIGGPWTAVAVPLTTAGAPGIRAPATSAVLFLAITYAGPRIGPTATVAVFLVVQFAAAIVVEEYGLFGLDRIAIGW